MKGNLMENKIQKLHQIYKKAWDKFYKAKTKEDRFKAYKAIQAIAYLKWDNL